MSWAAHNPEAYQKILEKAVAEKMCKEAAIEPTSAEWEFLLAIVSNLMEARVPVSEGAFKQFTMTEALVSWASQEVSDQESAYWSRQVDDAKMRDK